MKWNTNHNGFREECVYYKERSLWVSYKTEEHYYFSMLISLLGTFFNFENTRMNSFPFQTNIMFLKFRTNLLPAPENSKGHLRIESHHNWHFPSFTLKKLMIQMYQDQVSVLIFSRWKKKCLKPFLLSCPLNVADKIKTWQQKWKHDSMW